MAEKMERKSFDKPDETRPFKDGKGKLDVVALGDRTFGRGTFEPGWRWSEHVSQSRELRRAKPFTLAISSKAGWS
jgi:hypothetical protein